MKINKGYDIAEFVELETKIMNLIAEKKKLMKEMLKDEENSTNTKNIDSLNKLNEEIDTAKKSLQMLEENEQKLAFSGTCFVTFETI